jgi:hypothetical protein
VTPKQNAGMNIAEGHTLLLDPDHQGVIRCFQFEQGLLKVFVNLQQPVHHPGISSGRRSVAPGVSAQNNASLPC